MTLLVSQPVYTITFRTRPPHPRYYISYISNVRGLMGKTAIKTQGFDCWQLISNYLSNYQLMNHNNYDIHFNVQLKGETPTAKSPPPRGLAFCIWKQDWRWGLRHGRKSPIGNFSKIGAKRQKNQSNIFGGYKN